MLIQVTSTPRSVQAYFFIKESLLHLVLKARKIGNRFFVTKEEIVAAIKEQKKYGQRDVAALIEDCQAQGFHFEQDEILFK